MINPITKLIHHGAFWKLDYLSPNTQNNNNSLHVSNRIQVVKKCLDSPFSVYPENEESTG